MTGVRIGVLPEGSLGDATPGMTATLTRTVLARTNTHNEIITQTHEHLSILSSPLRGNAVSDRCSKG